MVNCPRSGSRRAIYSSIFGPFSDEVMSRKVRGAFAATRPPGHHAEVATPMGFCFFNNAAVAARHAQAAYGAERVATVDFDVHNSNGTQHIFWNDKTIMYASTHKMPLFPGTGEIGDRGEHHQIVNAPLRAGDGSEAGDDWFYRIDNRACLVRGSEGGAGLPFAMAHVTYRKIRSVPISPPPRWHLLAERDCSDG